VNQPSRKRDFMTWTATGRLSVPFVSLRPALNAEFPRAEIYRFCPA
jgi:hypothetical protein